MHLHRSNRGRLRAPPLLWVLARLLLRLSAAGADLQLDLGLRLSAAGAHLQLDLDLHLRRCRLAAAQLHHRHLRGLCPCRVQLVLFLLFLLPRSRPLLPPRWRQQVAASPFQTFSQRKRRQLSLDARKRKLGRLRDLPRWPRRPLRLLLLLEHLDCLTLARVAAFGELLHLALPLLV